MTTYFTADPHFARIGTNVLSRPFPNPLEMSEAILDGYNSRAGRGDRLIILGDFSFKEPAYWRQRLACRNTMLILGNHDPRAQDIAAFGRDNVREQYDTKCLDHPTYCSHYPHLYWPKSHYGSFSLYGHVHDQRTDTIEALFQLPWYRKAWNSIRGIENPETTIRSLDVGPESAFRILGKWTCFSEDEVYDILIRRPGHDNVEFYRRRRGEYKKDHPNVAA